MRQHVVYDSQICNKQEEIIHILLELRKQIIRPVDYITECVEKRQLLDKMSKIELLKKLKDNVQEVKKIRQVLIVKNVGLQELKKKYKSSEQEKGLYNIDQNVKKYMFNDTYNQYLSDIQKMSVLDFLNDKEKQKAVQSIIPQQIIDFQESVLCDFLRQQSANFPNFYIELRKGRENGDIIVFQIEQVQLAFSYEERISSSKPNQIQTIISDLNCRKALKDQNKNINSAQYQRYNNNQEQVPNFQQNQQIQIQEYSNDNSQYYKSLNQYLKKLFYLSQPDRFNNIKMFIIFSMHYLRKLQDPANTVCIVCKKYLKFEGVKEGFMPPYIYFKNKFSHHSCMKLREDFE